MSHACRTLTLALSLAASSALAQTLPTGVTIEPFYDIEKAGLSFKVDKQAVVGMWEVPGKPQHFLVLGYFGFVWSLYPDTTKPYEPGKIRDYTKRELANFNTMVMKGWEQGALGAGFDPNFKQTRAFYIIYNKYPNPSLYHTGFARGTGDGYTNPGLVVVERWKLSEDMKALARDTTILSMDHGTGYGSSNMVFGKDGMLYISTDSYSKNSWDSTDFMRKILRIDVSKQDPGKLYAVPPDNPWVNVTNPAVKKEIYAFGFRNTYSIVANHLTGSILGAEVGQVTWEEVNIIKPGRNYGWSDGGDGQVPPLGNGNEGPCNANTTAGQAFRGNSLMNPYRYSGALSQNRTYTCADFTNGTWNFHHAGNDYGGSKTAVPNLDMNCIIISPAFRGDPASPFHGYHFVTDVARNYFVAFREDQPGVAKQVGAVPSSMSFTGDRMHNGITAFAEDSYGNLYTIMLSSSHNGAFAYHDIYRMAHPQMKPLPTPREPSTVVRNIRAEGLRSQGFRPLVLAGAGPAWVRMPKDARRLELWTADGRIHWSTEAPSGEAVALPGNLPAGPLWTRFLP